MSAINEVSELYEAYIKGWDAALLRAAFICDDAERDAILALPARDAILALLKEAKEKA